MPLRRLATAILTLVLIAISGVVFALETTARAGLVIDHSTGTVLFEKNADEALPPASMSKLMTLNMLFEAMTDGRVALTDSFRVSQKAYEMGGSRMFLEVGREVTVEDLIKGIIVHSGNDACVVVAEALAGTEAEFARKMTARARELGMNDSHFANATGWPDPNHRMSARDLVFLATRLIREFPQYYAYFAVPEFTWNGIVQKNRNPLLAFDIGADGLKTGHTSEAGYGLVGSAVQDGRRVTFMLTGMASEQERQSESERIVAWAFREFFKQTLFETRQTIHEAAVWLGRVDKVAIVSNTPIVLMVPYEARDKVTAELIYQSPLEAPILRGQNVAELVVSVPNVGETRFALQAAEDVERGGFRKRFDLSARILLARVMSALQTTTN